MLSTAWLQVLPVARLDNLPFHLPEAADLKDQLTHCIDSSIHYTLMGEDQTYYLVFSNGTDLAKFARRHRYRGFPLFGRWCVPYYPSVAGCQDRLTPCPLLQATVHLYWMQETQSRLPIHLVSECSLRAMFREWLQPDDLKLFERIDVQIQQLQGMTVMVLLQLFEYSSEDLMRVNGWIHRSALDPKSKWEQEMRVSVPGRLQPLGSEETSTAPYHLSILIKCESVYRTNRTHPTSNTNYSHATTDSLDKHLLID